MRASDKKSARRAPKPRTLQVLQKVERLGVFTVEDTTRLGISQPTLSRLVTRGIVKRVGRGLYTHRYSKLAPKHWGFAMACRKFGYRAVIGGPSALHYHGLISKPPKKIWVIVGSHQKTATNAYRCLRAERKPMTGIEEKGFFRVTNLERTLVECLKHRGKMGREFSQRAVRDALRKKLTTSQRLSAMSIILSLPRSLRRFLSQLES